MSVEMKFEDASAFDKALNGDATIPSLPSSDVITFIGKNNATAGGRPAVLATFMVQLPDGSLARAQFTMTYREFINAAKGFEATPLLKNKD